MRCTGWPALLESLPHAFHAIHEIDTNLQLPEYGSAYNHGCHGLQFPALVDALTFTLTRLLIPHIWTRSHLTCISTLHTSTYCEACAVTKPYCSSIAILVLLLPALVIAACSSPDSCLYLGIDCGLRLCPVCQINKALHTRTRVCSCTHMHEVPFWRFV